MKAKVNLPRFRYNDFLFRITASLLGAHFVVMVGEKVSVVDVFFTSVYQIALWGSFAIAFALVSLVYGVTVFLDRKYDWAEKPFQRSVLQMVIGIGLSSLLAYPFAAIYFQVRGVDISTTEYWDTDYPLIVSLLAILNLLYLFHYTIRYFVSTLDYVDEKKNGMEAADKQISNNSETRYVGTEIRMFVPGIHDAGINIPQTDICYIFNDDKTNFLYLFDAENPVHINTSIKDCMLLLDADYFFQVNRWMIVNRQAISEVKFLPSNRRELLLRPAFQQAVIVSQKYTPPFGKWYDRSET